MKKAPIEIKPIKSQEDYKRTLKTIESLLECPPNSKEAETLEVLAIIVDDYENKHFPITLLG